MAYKLVIDSNSNTYNLSKYINERLNNLGLESTLLDYNLSIDDKINTIKNEYGTGNNIIVLSNRLGNDLEIIYALRNNSKLSKSINDSLIDSGFEVLKYYQLRNSNNSSLDDDYLIRNTMNNQTLVISYDNLNNIEKLGEGVVKGIITYTGLDYIPKSIDGYYKVQKGDTLWSIASKYNISVNTLKRINNLSSNIIKVGDYLKVKEDGVNNDNTLSYIVKKGDSLWKIANTYDTTVDMIKNTNNLKSNLLSIGQVLIIPSTTSYKTYVVKKGDTLYSIAKSYNTSVSSIMNLNNLKSSVLQIGQELIITS